MDASVPTTLLLLLALPSAWPWPASPRGVTSWPSPQQGGVIANVQVHHLGHSGLRSMDLAPAAQTYYEHLDARTPHQPLSAYRLQQHHPHAVQYAASTEAITTTYAPPHYTEQPTIRAPPYTEQPTVRAPYVQLDSSTQPSYQHAKSLLKQDGPDIQHELQLTLSQQIQVQLEQLQKLHALQNKMLRGKSDPQALQQGSENVHRQVLQPEQHAVVYAHTPAPFPQHVVTTASPVVYASPQPSATPAPPPLAEPRYPEESQSLTSFIGEPSTPPPVGGAMSNGFQPILPPRGHPAAAAEAEATDFQPFVEHATDPALPYYLLPPAADSDSEFNRLPAAHAGELEDLESPSAPASSVSAEHEDVEHPIEHSVRGKHRLRPPRGKGGRLHGQGGRGGHAMTQPLRKHCGSIAASLGAPCRLAAYSAAFAAARPTTTTTWRPPLTATSAGATAAGSAVRLRIASPRLRFRDAVDPRAPLTLMARHPGAPGRPPVTVVHAVHKIRIIKKV